MGIYINPPSGQPKEIWLTENAQRISNPRGQTPPAGKRFLVWVDNGGFTATAVAFDAKELDALTYVRGAPLDDISIPGMEDAVTVHLGNPDRDDRPRAYFVADYDKVVEAVGYKSERDLLLTKKEWR